MGKTTGTGPLGIGVPRAMREEMRADRVWSADRSLRSVQYAQLIDDMRRVGNRALRLCEHEPPLSGDIEFDVRLAATVESLCHECGIAPPEWVHAPSRYLERPLWAFGATNSQAKRHLEATTPPEFAARGLYTGEGPLSRC